MPCYFWTKQIIFSDNSKSKIKHLVYLHKKGPIINRTFFTIKPIKPIVQLFNKLNNFLERYKNIPILQTIDCGRNYFFNSKQTLPIIILPNIISLK